MPTWNRPKEAYACAPLWLGMSGDDALFRIACHAGEVSRQTGQVLDRGDRHIRRDIVGLVPEIADGDEFRARYVAGKAVRVQVCQDDVVAVAGDDHGRCGDAAI